MVTDPPNAYVQCKDAGQPDTAPEPQLQGAARCAA
jgi:hypothetical protein